MRRAMLACNRRREPTAEKRASAVEHFVQVAALAVVYALIARLGLRVDAVSGFATLLWPPSGIALAALLVGGFRLWPGIAIGAFAANLWVGAPLSAALGIAAGKDRKSTRLNST